MAFSFSNILGQNKNTPKVLPKLEYKGGTKFAVNEMNDVYIDFEELGGYPFLKTVIIGDLCLKIKRHGCTISFVFKEDTITLESDNTTIDSNQVKKTGVFVSEIDFELDETEANRIKKGKIKEVFYTAKGKKYSFKPL